MTKRTRISVLISEATWQRLEKNVRASGVKIGHLLEQALLHHLQALEELPADAVVHPRIVASEKSFRMVVKQVQKGKPTRALRELMRGGA